MANDDKNKVVEVNFADFLPAGLSADELTLTGGLTPTYSPKEAFENRYAPVGGWIDRLQKLAPVKQGGGKVYEPLVLLVRDISRPTKGVLGPKTDRKVVDVPAGKDILIPITGNISTNRELIQAMADTEHVYFAIFQVVGQMPVDSGPSDMWVWKIMLHPQKKARTGVYSLPLAPNTRHRLGMTVDGTLYDSATGEVVERPIVAGNGAGASA